jgi:hypothetical protein
MAKPIVDPTSLKLQVYQIYYVFKEHRTIGILYRLKVVVFAIKREYTC